MNIVDFIKEKKIIAIIRRVDIKEVISTVKALYEGGIRLMEVTFDQSSGSGEKDAMDCIRILNDYFEEQVYVGAGTVLTAKQVEIAIKAGAKYIISPNVDYDVMKKTLEMGAISIPGAFTPSEIVTAYNNGASFVKIFPADLLGINYIKAIRSPIRHIPLLAVGGVNIKNMKDFISAGVVGVGVGSNLVDKDLIDHKRFDELEALAKCYTETI